MIGRSLFCLSLSPKQVKCGFVHNDNVNNFRLNLLTVNSILSTNSLTHLFNDGTDTLLVTLLVDTKWFVLKFPDLSSQRNECNFYRIVVKLHKKVFVSIEHGTDANVIQYEATTGPHVFCYQRHTCMRKQIRHYCYYYHIPPYRSPKRNSTLQSL